MNPIQYLLLALLTIANKDFSLIYIENIIIYYKVSHIKFENIRFRQRMTCVCLQNIIATSSNYNRLHDNN